MKLITTTACCALLAAPAFAVEESAVVETYSDIAAAAYGDSLTTARASRSELDALLGDPSAVGLEAVKDAWLAAGVPYQQAEVHRFGNPMVDDWESKVNAWPLDEGLIDDVSAEGSAPTEGYDDNLAAGLNVVANPSFVLSGTEIDAATITPALLDGTLHEAGGADANVATGYHAVEFLLRGQDLGA